MKISNRKGEGMVVPELGSEPILVSGRGGPIGSGNVVFYTIRERQYVRKYVKPRDPKTEKQQAHRKLFGEVSKEWRRLSAKEREDYNQRARPMGMSGFKLFRNERAAQVRLVSCSGIEHS